MILQLPPLYDVSSDEQVLVLGVIGRYWVERGEKTSLRKNPNPPDSIR